MIASAGPKVNGICEKMIPSGEHPAAALIVTLALRNICAQE